MRRKYIEDFSELERMLVMDTNFSEASHDWKSQASFHGLTHPCQAEPVKRRFPVAVFRYLPVRASTGSFSPLGETDCPSTIRAHLSRL